MQYYNDNKIFFDSKNFDLSNQYYLLKLKANVLSILNLKKEELKTKELIIDILFLYKNKVAENYKESLSIYYNSLNFDSFKLEEFKSLIYLINKHNSEIADFNLFGIKELLEASSINEKQLLLNEIVNKLENNQISEFNQKTLHYLINYLIIPYGEINKLNIQSREEKKLIIHYYYIRYLLSKNSFWLWKNNPDYKLLDEKIELSSFNLIYNDFHSHDIDIKFKDGDFDFLKAKHKIIDEILKKNNSYKSNLIYGDFLDKINYEISIHETEGNFNDDDFILSILNKNISLFKEINSNYSDLIRLLFAIYADIQKLILGLDSNLQIKKINKLKSFLKSKLDKEMNIKDVNFRIIICNNLEDFNQLTDTIETLYKLKKYSIEEHVNLINSLNFLEYDLYSEQFYGKDDYNNKLNKNLLVLANKAYTYFISNIEYFNNYNDYFGIIELIKKYNFEPNINLINKYLTFYKNPGKMLTNFIKYSLDKNLGELYYRIKNYSKARQYFYAANANTLIYEEKSIAMQRWELLMNIFFCNILDSKLSKNEIAKNIIYIKKVFETDINRIKNLKSDNLNNILLEITYRYNEICLYEARNQNDYLTEKNILIEQLEINKTVNLYDNFNTELNLIKCESKLNEISNEEKFKLISQLYNKYNKTPDISYALAAEEINDFNYSFNIQLKIYTEELTNNLNYINKLSFNNQINYLNEIWDNRQFTLRPYFKLSDEDKLKNLNQLINFFILSDNLDVNNFNLYANNDSDKIDELILEKKKLFNSKSSDEDYNKISNNIDFLQQKLKFKENNIIWNIQLLKDNLKDNQAYIRIFSHNSLDYHAFVVTNKNSELIDLNKRKNIDFEKALNTYLKNTKDQFESPLAFDIFYSKIFSALPKQINELFFQNEGVYINLNPDGFKSNSTQKYLIEDYDIHTINSSYLFNNLDSTINIENALFIGNPKFQIEETTVKNTSIVSNNTRGTLSPLPNTQNEVIEVSKQLNDVNIKTHCLLQNDATEENFNKLSSSYELIHIATHGFYKDDGTLKIDQYNFGLYLTGALDYINNNKEKTQMIDEGIVYAPEIELLNLSKVKLVVLSACETGFGRQSKIGKISLSSSFIMAGAKNVLSTLWKIDDKVTKEFINEFYKKLLQLKNIKIALRQTQLEFLEKYKSPYYWAPFMLLQNRG